MVSVCLRSRYRKLRRQMTWESMTTGSSKSSKGSMTTTKRTLIQGGSTAESVARFYFLSYQAMSTADSPTRQGGNIARHLKSLDYSEKPIQPTRSTGPKRLSTFTYKWCGTISTLLKLGLRLHRATRNWAGQRLRGR